MEHIKIGQRWKEVDPRMNRVVEVVGFDRDSGKILILYAGKTTKAKPERFNGKRGGYALVSTE